MPDEPSLDLAPLIARDIFQVVAGLRETVESILLVEQNTRVAQQVADYATRRKPAKSSCQGRASNSPPIPRVIECYPGLASAKAG